ncbi:hypothetical protein Ae406Ps2_6436 [Pseudonocardia sp. Ae406_Ps2]|nr:hypothetical protein Ae406Ps2_6436 [Pseudonocardia sp. Ae406_Ps2]
MVATVGGCGVLSSLASGLIVECPASRVKGT